MTMMSLGRLRHLKVNFTEDDINKTEQDILEDVSNFIIKHFENNQGTLPQFGRIKQYVLTWNNQRYLFDTDGCFLHII